MNGKIYVIRNKINDKVYIGQTTMTVQSRFQHHLSSKPESHHYQAILCAIRKHGKENFWVETLVEGIETHEELDRLEEKYIAEFNSMKPNGYNLCPGGQKWRNSARANIEPDQGIVSDYLSGMSTRAVAEKHGCSTKKVRYHVEKAGHQLRKNNNEYSAHASALTEKRLKELYLNSNMTNKQIAELTGLSERWVRKRRQTFDIHRI